jgi:hypothetical protein
MSGTCSTHGIGFWLKILKETDNIEHLDVDGMTILKEILRKQIGGCGMDSPKDRRQ